MMSQQYQVEYDNKGQLDRIEALLIHPELLYAVFDLKGGGTGFVGSLTGGSYSWTKV
jgi:hypothetical protein